MKIDNNTAKKLKKDFPIFKNNLGLIYLDNAATSQKPEAVIKAVNDFYEKENANISRGLYTLAEKATRRYEEARNTVARFVNAKPQEIIFTRNTTESLNLLAYTISPMLSKGKDEILLTEMEHHSNLVPWQQLVKRNGMKLKFVKIKDDFTLDMNDLREKLTNKTSIVAFTYVSNVLGTVNPVEEIVKLAKFKGAITIVDAAQAVQHVSIDVKKIDCDFLAFSSHKMLGPTGIGVLYGKKELLDRMQPFNFGGGMISRVTKENSEWAEVPSKFEAGTQSIAEAVGLSAAIKYLEQIGVNEIGQWEKELTEYAYQKLSKIEGLKIYTSKNSSSIISFNLKGIHPHDVSGMLNESKIAIRAGHHCAMPLMEVLNSKGGVCRVSFSLYNTLEDVDALFECLTKIKEKFK